MKKLNALMLAFTLLMGVSFTSCLNSGDTEAPYDMDILTYINESIYTGVSFKDGFGNTYEPTSESINGIETQNPGIDWSEFKMGFIAFKWVVAEGAEKPEINTNPDTPQTYTIDLLRVRPIEVPMVLFSPTAENIESVAPSTAPVIPLRQTQQWGDIVPQMYDTKTVIMLTGFYTTNDNDEFKKHTVKMVYAMDEIEEADDKLTVYIHHDRGDDEKAEVAYGNYYAFNLEQALLAFKSAHNGTAPKKIIIKAKETNYASTELPEKYTEYEVEYKETLEMP